MKRWELQLNIFVFKNAALCFNNVENNTNTCKLKEYRIVLHTTATTKRKYKIKHKTSKRMTKTSASKIPRSERGRYKNV